jgi:Fe-Mn family superoxide dismutase
MKNLVNKIERIEKEIIKSESKTTQKFFLSEMKRIGIEKLPYSFASLKRFIDPETMDYHYNKHYKGYVEKLNTALNKRKFGDLDLEQIVKSISRFNKTIRNNAGGAYNHALFWKMLSPKPQKPKGQLLRKIESVFGGVPAFKKKFEEECKERFGSGWCWLVITKNNSLKIVSTPNQDNPLMNDVKDGGYPILGLDLWEHAYYLKYRNKRDEYIKNFWDAVNWEFVEKLYLMKVETKLTEEVVLEQLMRDNNDFLLIEQQNESQSCSSEETKLFKRLLFPPTNLLEKSKEYGEFIKEYTAGWMDVLRKSYPENWKERNQLFQGHEAGLYTKENVRSLLMNLTSSYVAFCIIHKDINQYLKSTNQKIIEYGDDPKKNLLELRRFFSVLDGLRATIFKRGEQSITLNKIGRVLKKSDCLGKRNEQASEQIINQILGANTCEIKSGGGISNDMYSGIDAILNIEGKRLKAQIKPFTNAYKKEFDTEEYYIVEGASSTKAYKTVDLLIFVNVKTKNVKIFNSKNVRINQGNYIIPSNYLAYDLFAKEPIELIDCNKYLSENMIWE